ncbi:MAG: DUF5661 family protein [Bacteroidota bacterium]|jgi:hypothetical protein
MFSIKEIIKHIQDIKTVSEKKQFSFAEGKQIGDALGIRWGKFEVEQFTMGLNVELEHGRKDPATDVTHDEPMVTGKIAWAHLNKIPDYYTRLAVMEQEAERVKSTLQRGYLREMPSTKKNTLLIVLSAAIYAVMFTLKVRHVSKLFISTKVGLRHGSPPALKTKS